MMKYIKILGFIVSIVIILSMAGCYRSTVTSTIPAETITITSTTSMTFTTLINKKNDVEQIAYPTLLKWYDSCSWVGQDKIYLNDVDYGDTIDTWTNDINGVTGYLWKKGEPLCFTIYNDKLTEEEYIIVFDNGNYGQPSGYTNWVSVSTYKPLVPAQTAMNIPVKIQIPEKPNVIIPEQWEFRIDVRPVSTDSIQYESCVRFLINMK